MPGRTLNTSAKLADKLPLGIASMCLGRATAGHDLKTKFAAAAEAGYKGVEAFYEDIKIPARQAMKKSGRSFQEELLISAQTFKDLADLYNLEIFVLQPFKNYEGLLSKKRHDEKIDKMKLFFKMAKILGTDLIQIPTMFWKDKSTGNLDKIVADLQEVADMGAKESPPIRFAYEMMAWAPYVESLQQLWKVVKLVDRDNFGMCLDTFQILAVVWADCTSESGVRPKADEILERDMKEFKAAVPVEKVYFVQLSDAERLQQPINPSHPWYNARQNPNMTWSRNARLFPLEEKLGGYLPVLRMLEFWVREWGYRGWVSMEVFNRTMLETNDDVPRIHAERGVASWQKCIKALRLDEIDA